MASDSAGISVAAAQRPVAHHIGLITSASAAAPLYRPLLRLLRRRPCAARPCGGGACRPLLRRRPRAARFCGGAHVPPASTAAPTCRPLLRRRPRAARSCDGAHVPPAYATAPTCRPLMRWRPCAARSSGGGVPSSRPLLRRRPLPPAPATVPSSRPLLRRRPRAARPCAVAWFGRLFERWLVYASILVDLQLRLLVLGWLATSRARLQYLGVVASVSRKWHLWTELPSLP